MSPSFVVGLLFVLLLVNRSRAVLKSVENAPLTDGSERNVSLVDLQSNEAFMQQITIAPTSNIIFSITDIPSNIFFIIFQIHTYQYNITLSYDKASLNKVSNGSVFGSNVGLFVRTDSIKQTQLFLKNDNVHSIQAMVVASGYSNQAPIPGGCNMEFNTVVAPYEKLVVKDEMVVVDMQPASVPIFNDRQQLCEKNPVQHDVYQMYLTEQDFTPESYFTAIKSMLTVENILQNGTKVPSPSGTSPMRRVFSAYPGTGAVYVAVASYQDYSTAYVPTFSYGCNPTLYPESCEVLKSGFSKVCCAFAFILGFISVFFGAKSLKTDMSLPIFVTGCIAGFSIANGTSYGTDGSILIAIAMGIGALIIWGVCQNWIFQILMFSFSIGFFVASVLYFSVPGDQPFLQNDWIFWTLFLTIIVAVALFMAILNFLTFIVTCAIFGSYLMILPIDYYAGSCLKYIIINVIRRTTIADFGMAIILPPFQGKDMTLLILWVCLILYRVVAQCTSGLSLFSCCINRISETTPLIINSRFTPRVNVNYY